METHLDMVDALGRPGGERISDGRAVDGKMRVVIDLVGRIDALQQRDSVRSARRFACRLEARELAPEVRVGEPGPAALPAVGQAGGDRHHPRTL